ncbi:hypothetical protein BvCms6BK_03393 [Escherichia coli]|nr:hypothetical protein BvCms6BK_03393 [Escherichia coli]
MFQLGIDVSKKTLVLFTAFQASDKTTDLQSFRG